MAPAAVALAGLAALGACGGGGGPAVPDTRVPDGAPFIDQRSLAFKPDNVRTKAGEQVYFKNSETAIHTVTTNGKNASGSMTKNELFVWTPPAAGSYRITCDFHPQMRATVTVE